MRQQPGHVPVRLARPPVPCTAPSVPRQLPIPRVLSLLLSWPRCRRKAGGGRAAVVSPGSPRTLPRCPRAPRAGNAFLSRTASFPTPCLGPTSAPRRPGFLPQFPSRLRSARRPCTGRVLTPRPAPPRAPPWVRASSPALEPVPETQVDKAPSVTCPPTSPLLPCLTASAGQALGGWRTGDRREGGEGGPGRPWRGPAEDEEGLAAGGREPRRQRKRKGP